MPRNRFSFRNNSLQLTPMTLVQVVKLFRGYQSYPAFGVTLIVLIYKGLLWEKSTKISILFKIFKRQFLALSFYSFVGKVVRISFQQFLPLAMT